MLRACSIAIVVITGVVMSCSPYSPDLDTTPFLCGSAAPKCPDGFSCTGSDSMGRPVCLENGKTAPDAANLCADDSAIEGSGGNNSIATATATPVQSQINTIMYGGLAICPIGDQDYYEVDITGVNQAFRALITYDTWGAALQGSVLTDTSGEQPSTLLTFDGVAGSANTLRAEDSSIPPGTYYIEVSASAGSNSGINNYTLEIDVCTDSTTAPCNE